MFMTGHLSCKTSSNAIWLGLKESGGQKTLKNVNTESELERWHNWGNLEWKLKVTGIYDIIVLKQYKYKIIVDNVDKWLR